MKILDLCCGHGLASIGYKAEFPDAEMTGVDIVDMSSSYPFSFVNRDAFSLDYEYLSLFDFIHISPPCQRYSKVTPKRTRDSHPHLIPNALLLAYASGKPFVVENVPGSTKWLRPTCTIVTGGKVRHFHSNFHIPNITFEGVSDIMSTRYSSKDEVFRTWKIPATFRLSMRQLRQGIPPLMTMHIGASLKIATNLF